MKKFLIVLLVFSGLGSLAHSHENILSNSNILDKVEVVDIEVRIKNEHPKSTSPLPIQRFNEVIFSRNFLYAVGYTKNGQDNEDIAIAKFSMDGEQLRSKVIDLGFDENGWGITQLQNGDFIIAAFGNQENDKGDIILLSLAGDLSLKWIKRAVVPLEEYSWSISSTPNNEAVVVGQTGTDYEENTNVFLLKVDQDGNLSWAKQIQTSFAQRGIGIDIFPDGSVLFVANDRDVSAKTRKRDIAIGVLNPDGELISYSLLHGSGDDVVHDVMVMDGNLALVTGYISTGAEGARDVYLAKVDNTGQLIEDKIINLPKEQRAMRAAANDRCYFITGYQIDGRGKPFLMTLDQSFEVIDMEVFSAKLDAGAYGISLIPNANIVSIAGYSQLKGRSGLSGTLYFKNTNNYCHKK